jgi:glycerol-3-phosphate acyltransferase PlsY
VSDAGVVLALTVTVALVPAVSLLTLVPANRLLVLRTVATRVCAAPVVAVAAERRAAVFLKELGDCSCRVFGSVL